MKARDTSQPSSTEHFSRDYNQLMEQLTRAHGPKKAVQLAVGAGNVEQVGARQARLMQHIGLKDGQSVVDCGCGSGRTASAISKKFNVKYLGIDVVPELLAHARSICPPAYRFVLGKGLEIPEEDNSVDFVVMFSLLTHLYLDESYIYVSEAKRVLKPGGKLVASYLELGNPNHYNTFKISLDHKLKGKPRPLTAYIETSVWHVWAKWLDMDVLEQHRGGEMFLPLSEDGSVKEAMGQSVIALQK